jgi:tetratricopeptide (TPR) repeat protein
MGVLLSVSVGIGIYYALGSVLSLSLSESLVARTKEFDAVPLKDESPDQFEELANMWSSKEQNIANNPIAVRVLADGMIHDYQMSQFKLIDVPPESTGTTEWGNTSPLLLHLVLAHLKNLKDQGQLGEAKKVTRKIVEQFSKEDDDEKAKEDYEKALGQLEKAADMYARGQAKSPLDWRLAFGRTFSNMTCTPEELAVLLPAVNQLARHNSQLLLTNALIFGDQLEPKQLEEIRIQAMKSNPASYLNVAMVIANEQKDGGISIDLFPQRYDVMQDLATGVFKKDKYPETHRLLWERSRDLIVKAPMKRSLKEVMLADTSRALGDSDAELKHLQEARKLGKTNVKLMCRLAHKYLDIADVSESKSLREEAENLWKEANGLASADQEVKDLGQRIKKGLTVP